MEVVKNQKENNNNNFCIQLGRHAHSNGTHAGVGSGPNTPTSATINSWNNLPLERSKSKFASLSRLFKPWKWRVRRKSDKLESVSQCKHRILHLLSLALCSRVKLRRIVLKLGLMRLVTSFAASGVSMVSLAAFSLLFFVLFAKGSR